VEIIKINGKYRDLGKIELENSKIINWSDLSDNNPPTIPFGSEIEVLISIDNNDFLSGKNGIVWATYDLRQAEIIHSALLAQNINSEIKNEHLFEDTLFLIKIMNENDIQEAANFIWKSGNGLRLKPDWHYNKGESNKTFEQWLSGH